MQNMIQSVLIIYLNKCLKKSLIIRIILIKEKTYIINKDKKRM